MKSIRGKAPVVRSKPAKAKRKLTPKDLRVKVFEGTIGDRKFLFDANALSLIQLAEITGTSPKDFADRNNMVIVSRAVVDVNVVKTLKKTWAAAKADQASALLQQEKAVAEVKRAAKRKH